VAHSCGVEGLDDLVPSTSAGSWKRRADALERLAVAGADDAVGPLHVAST
jgi:hypothetical protein